MQNIKRLLCVLLALLLALPAWAAETPAEEEPPAPFEDESAPGPFEDEAPAPEDAGPVIQVSVPASGRIGLNPYHMDIPTSAGTSADQIVHEPQIIINGSDFPVRVSARAVGKLGPESGARFVSAPPAADARDKEIFLYMEFQNDLAFWTGAYGDWPNQLLVTDFGGEKADVMTLDAMGVGYFRLFGAMTDSPFEMWGETDAPDVTLALTFSAWEADVQPEEEFEDGSSEEPAEEPSEEPSEEPEEGPVGDSPEEPAEEAPEGPVEGPIEAPAEEPVEKPAEEPVEEPIEDSTEEPAESPAEEPSEEPAEEPVQGPPEEPTEENNG